MPGSSGSLIWLLCAIFVAVHGRYYRFDGGSQTAAETAAQTDTVTASQTAAQTAAQTGGQTAAVAPMTEKDRKQEARDIIKYQFKQPISEMAPRKWKQMDTKEIYVRFESEQTWCSIKGTDCWHISLHVHPEEQKQWDRMYVFSYEKGEDGTKKKAFIGAISPFGLWKEKDLVKSEGITRPQCKEYCTQYKLKKERTILIQQMVNMYSVRVDPDNNKELNGMGGAGAYAQWDAIPADDGTMMFKSKKTGKYLRMMTETEIDADGSGKGKASQWKVTSKDDYKLVESVKFPGKYLAVSEKGKKIRVGTGGKWCKMILNKKTAK